MKPDRTSRRDFLKFVSATPVALSSGLLRAANRPRIDFPTDARSRLSVSTYPFRSVIASPKGAEKNTSAMSLTDFAQSIPAKLHVHGIEPWSHHFTSTDPAYVHTLRNAFDKAGLRVVNIPVDLPARLCGTAPDREAALQTYYRWVDAAIILGSPSIRIHLPHGETGDRISCSVGAIKDLAAYGASKNIVVNVENDEPAIEQAERIAKVIRAVDSPFFHALPDFCNSMLVHDDPEYVYRSMALLFPLALNISHVKDQESDNGKTYRVDVNRIFSIAQKAGYRGYFSMEWEGEGDPYEGSAKLIEASLRNLT